jgi:dienelactone hydrolase
MSLIPKRRHVATNVDHSRSPVIIPLAILLVLALLGGLATLFALRHGGVETAGGSGDAVPVVGTPSSKTFVPTGPYGVGVMTLRLSSNGAPVEVWYPANADDAHGAPATLSLRETLPPAIRALLPAKINIVQDLRGFSGLAVAEGRFPVVLFSHGFAAWRTQSTFLTSHLASWGFVVAAPEHLDRDLTSVLAKLASGSSTSMNLTQSSDVTDLENTISLMGDQNASSSSPFYRHLDMSRVGAVGHSAGGSAVEKLAVADSQVKVFVGLAGAAYGAFGQTAEGLGAKAPLQPGMLMFGEQDAIVPPSSIKNAYNLMNQPKRLIGLFNSGHLVFSDICTLANGSGGLVAVAEKAGLPIPAQLALLGTDGCASVYSPVASDWPVINQAVTAELRVGLGFDQGQGGLENLETVFSQQVSFNTTASSVPGAAAPATTTNG